MLCDLGEVERRRRRSQTAMCGLLVSLLTTIAVAAHELIDTPCRINELSLARVEGVRRVGDLYLDERIGLAIDLDSLLSVGSTLRDGDFVVGHIFECHWTVILRM